MGEQSSGLITIRMSTGSVPSVHAGRCRHPWPEATVQPIRVAGLSLIIVAMLVSSWEFAPALATTLAAIVGFGLVVYGVHVAWLVFYDREPDGPSS